MVRYALTIYPYSLYQGKKSWQKERLSWMEPNRSGNCGQYLRVLNWASEYGLSLLTGPTPFRGKLLMTQVAVPVDL